MGFSKRPLGACETPSGSLRNSQWELAKLPVGALQAPSGSANTRPVSRPRSAATRRASGPPPVRPRCPTRAQARGRPRVPARDAPLTHPLALAGMSTSNASVRPQGKRKPVTDAELPAELKHFYNQYAKTFLTQRSGAARTASTAASQGGTALLAMDFLVRPSLPPTPALPLALPTQTCPRPPHPPSDLTFRAQDQAGAELKAVPTRGRDLAPRASRYAGGSLKGPRGGACCTCCTCGRRVMHVPGHGAGHGDRRAALDSNCPTRVVCASSCARASPLCLTVVLWPCACLMLCYFVFDLMSLCPIVFAAHSPIHLAPPRRPAGRMPGQKNLHQKNLNPKIARKPTLRSIRWLRRKPKFCALPLLHLRYRYHRAPEPISLFGGKIPLVTGKSQPLVGRLVG